MCERWFTTIALAAPKKKKRPAPGGCGSPREFTIHRSLSDLNCPYLFRCRMVRFSTGRRAMAKTFGYESTADEVLEGVNLSGKRVLVTGVSAGLGVETARSIVAHGGTVVGTARDLAKARNALSQAGNPAVELVETDLASLASVRKAADGLLASAKPFDVIIANAGVMACPQGKTKDGFETQFGTNHLGHFVFVNRLVPLLK